MEIIQRDNNQERRPREKRLPRYNSFLLTLFELNGWGRN